MNSTQNVKGHTIDDLPYIFVVARTGPRACEIGANVGHNLIALQSIVPSVPSLHVTSSELNPSVLTISA